MKQLGRQLFAHATNITRNSSWDAWPMHLVCPGCSRAAATPVICTKRIIVISMCFLAELRSPNPSDSIKIVKFPVRPV